MDDVEILEVRLLGLNFLHQNVYMVEFVYKGTAYKHRHQAPDELAAITAMYRYLECYGFNTNAKVPRLGGWKEVLKSEVNHGDEC